MHTLLEYNPVTTVLYFLFVITIVMLSMNPVIAGISLVFSVALFEMLSRKSTWRDHLFLFLFGLFLTLLNPLTYHNGVTVLFVLNDNPVTLEALIYGAVSSIRIVSVIYWFRSFSMIMTEDRLLYVLGRISPKTALAVSMAVRYVSLLRKKMTEINQAQKAIGLYKEDNLFDTVKGGARVFSILVTWALENGIITADSMASRGYGTGRRTSFSLFRFRRRDAVLAVILLMLFVPCLVIIIQKTAETVYYPEFSMAGKHLPAIALYLLFLMLSVLPELLLLEDRLSWKYYLSKI